MIVVSLTDGFIHVEIEIKMNIIYPKGEILYTISLTLMELIRLRLLRLQSPTVVET